MHERRPAGANDLHHVFGYGSLLELHRVSPDAGPPVVCELGGYRRTWNVAMDNRQTLPGYKHYVDRETGARGSWFVTFLNIVPDADATVNGVMFDVDDAALERLDQRERNYDRVDLSGALAEAVDGPVWTYVGSAAAARRFRIGCLTDRAVISRDYYDSVRKDFARLGSDALARYADLTDPVPCPMLDLRRIDHEAAGARHAAARRAAAT
jgi:cation transport regulator ChaC